MWASLSTATNTSPCHLCLSNDESRVANELRERAGWGWGWGVVRACVLPCGGACEDRLRQEDVSDWGEGKGEKGWSSLSRWIKSELYRRLHKWHDP